jgi:RimJ/RimL family protein N-acetyltransferase
MITLRPATMNDSETLFAWRNDPGTLACFRSTEAVPREDHNNWMQYSVAQGYPLHLVLIAEGTLGKIGVVRFDTARNDVMKFEVSLTIAPPHRGKGMAAGILGRACGFMDEYTLTAAIRDDNTASQRAFERCGFQLIDTKDGFRNYQRQPQ